MKKIIQNNISFLSVYLLFFLLISSLLFTTGKIDSQIFANSFHHTFFDYFFYYFTKIIEIPVVIIFLFIFLFKNAKYGIIGIIIYLLNGVVSSLFKLFVFSNAKRPTVLIENLRLIPDSFGFEQLSNNSFPSGHTTAGFSVFLFLAIITTHKRWKIIFGVCAVLVGYSRVYLSQHFFEDLLFGSSIGVFGTIIFFYLFDKIKFGNWALKPIINLKK